MQSPTFRRPLALPSLFERFWRASDSNTLDSPPKPKWFDRFDPSRLHRLQSQAPRCAFVSALREIDEIQCSFRANGINKAKSFTSRNADFPPIEGSFG